ncbi:MAG: hypothetical protein IJH83_05490 [Coriobacteriales bacterium]|nr:hypothetical protein [Coriobacteriales bacterium]
MRISAALPILLAVIVLAAVAFTLVGCRTDPAPTPAPASDNATVAPSPAANTTQTAEPTPAPTPAPAADPAPEPDPPHPKATMVVEINGKQFHATPTHDESGEAFLQKLDSQPLEVTLHQYGGFEMTGALPWSLPRNDVQMTTVPGDIVLYNGNQICIFYGSNSWDYSLLAHIENSSAQEIADAMGSGDITVRIWLEWSE